MALNRKIQRFSFAPDGAQLLGQLVLSSLGRRSDHIFHRRFLLQSPALQVAGFIVKRPSGGQKCRKERKRIFQDFLHCMLEFPSEMHIIGVERNRLQDILHDIERYGQEGTRMMWILLAALVVVVTLSVKEQLDREREADCLHQLSREYSL